MIIGAFYWAMLVFGGVVVLLSALGIVVQLQDQTLDLRNIGFTIAFGIFGGVIATYSASALRRGDPGFFGIRAGPLFGRTNMAGRGCLFVFLVFGAGLLLYGPVILFQLPSMAAEDRATFGIGAAITFVLGALLVTLSVLLLRRGRERSRDEANDGRDDAGEQREG